MIANKKGNENYFFFFPLITYLYHYLRIWVSPGTAIAVNAVLGDVDVCIHRLWQGSPTFFELWATSWVPINVKGYQFDTRFWHNKFARFTFNCMLLLIVKLISYIHLLRTLLILTNLHNRPNY